jgi:hypothetical protein
MTKREIEEFLKLQDLKSAPEENMIYGSKPDFHRFLFQSINLIFRPEQYIIS